MKETAVELLIRELDLDNNSYNMKRINQAKEMEKEQIMDAYGVGFNNGCSYMFDGKTEYNNLEEYYKETYGK